MPERRSCNIKELRSLCQDAEPATVGLGRATKSEAWMGPVQFHDSIAPKASGAHLLLRQRSSLADRAAEVTPTSDCLQLLFSNCVKQVQRRDSFGF